MSSRLSKLRHPWLWYAAGAEAFIVAGAVLLMARSASAPPTGSPPQVVSARHDPAPAPAIARSVVQARLSHIAADK